MNDGPFLFIANDSERAWMDAAPLVYEALVKSPFPLTVIFALECIYYTSFDAFNPVGDLFHPPGLQIVNLHSSRLFLVGRWLYCSLVAAHKGRLFSLFRLRSHHAILKLLVPCPKIYNTSIRMFYYTLVVPVGKTCPLTFAGMAISFSCFLMLNANNCRISRQLSIITCRRTCLNSKG